LVVGLNIIEAISDPLVCRIIEIELRLFDMKEERELRWERLAELEENDIREWLMEGKGQRFCLNPAHAGRPAGPRHLCKTCYSTAQRLVKANLITWAELEHSGKAMPPQAPDHTKANSVRAWLLSDSKAA
jgi:hypothetical protein